MSIQAALLPDGKRLHLNHGPIDLVIEASGRADNIAKAYEAATRRFAHVLHGLVSELALLRREVKEKADWPNGEIARRMVEVTAPHWADRVTPMAAVAGPVADNILATMMQTAELDRAYVNNGGDIAIHLATGQHYAIASTAGMLSLSSSDGIQGIATSGWSGRSFSLGIADSVTVLAASAAEADVAATLIANAVDLPQSAKVTREPANVLSPDSDLGSRLVTTAVAALTPEEKRAALTAGHAVANGFLRRGFIVAAAFRLQGLVSFAGECQHFSASSLKLPAKAQELVHA